MRPIHVHAAGVGDEKLTVALVHFNTPEATARCLSSLLQVLRESLPESFRIVVIDNRSDNASFDQLNAAIAALDAPEILLVRNCINGGFGLGCMMALNYSAGRFIAFVNSDTLFDTDCFTPLIEYLEAHPEIGVIGPQHLSDSGEPQRSYGFNESLSARLGLRRKRYPKTEATSPVDVDYIFGAFMMFPREALADSGGFDPTIFLFCEEMDICWRLRAAGKRVVFFPGARFRHVGQASFGDGAERDSKPESDLSLLYVMRKNHGYWSWRLFFLSKFLSYLFRAPFRQRQRLLLRRLISMGPPQALSRRLKQKCNLDYVNR